MNMLFLIGKTINLQLVFGTDLVKVKTYRRGLESLDPEVSKRLIAESPLD